MARPSAERDVAAAVPTGRAAAESVAPDAGGVTGGADHRARVVLRAPQLSTRRQQPNRARAAPAVLGARSPSTRAPEAGGSGRSALAQSAICDTARRPNPGCCEPAADGDNCRTTLPRVIVQAPRVSGGPGAAGWRRGRV